MASMTTTEVIGFCDNVLQFLQDHQAELEAKGLAATMVIANLEALKKTAVAKNAEQETTKALLRTLTQETVAALKAVYGSTSSSLDAAIGVLDKGTPLAKQAARLRSDVINSKRSKKKSAGPAQ